MYIVKYKTPSSTSHALSEERAYLIELVTVFYESNSPSSLHTSLITSSCRNPPHQFVKLQPPPFQAKRIQSITHSPRLELIQHQHNKKLTYIAKKLASKTKDIIGLLIQNLLHKQADEGLQFWVGTQVLFIVNPKLDFRFI